VCCAVLCDVLWYVQCRWPLLLDGWLYDCRVSGWWLQLVRQSEGGNSQQVILRLCCWWMVLGLSNHPSKGAMGWHLCPPVPFISRWLLAAVNLVSEMNLFRSMLLLKVWVAVAMPCSLVAGRMKTWSGDGICLPVWPKILWCAAWMRGRTIAEVSLAHVCSMEQGCLKTDNWSQSRCCKKPRRRWCWGSLEINL
jgi:hypothetical protein